MRTPGPRIGSFACALGDETHAAQEIPAFEELWATTCPGSDFTTMGCPTFRRMSRPIETYIADSVGRTLADSGATADDIDHVVFSTTDPCLARLGPDFTIRALAAAGLWRAVPSLVALQQCCSSLAALHHACALMTVDEGIGSTLVVAFDQWHRDADRLRSFALFSDAAATCLVTRDGAAGGLRLSGCTVTVDRDGLTGRDSLGSRQHAARTSLHRTLATSGLHVDDVTMAFPTNLYTPLTVISAAAAGIHRTKLHFESTSRRAAHCGTSDWMLNLIDYRTTIGMSPGGSYLALASAPGFFASGVLVAEDR